MGIRISWPPRWSMRSACYFVMRVLAKLAAPVRRKGRIIASGWLLRLLLTFGAFLTVLCIFFMLATQDASVHITCPCYGVTVTEKRMTRHMDDIMGETDPSTGRTTLESLKAEHPFLAVDFLLSQERRGWRCPLVPGLFSIRYTNTLWQQAMVGTVTFLLYSAYYDHRDPQKRQLIRILCVADSSSPPTPTCHLYPSVNAAPVATKALKLDFIHWQHPLPGKWFPYLITCQTGDLISEVVSVVGHACEPTTNALVVAHAPAPNYWAEDATIYNLIPDDILTEESLAVNLLPGGHFPSNSRSVQHEPANVSLPRHHTETPGEDHGKSYRTIYFNSSTRDKTKNKEFLLKQQDTEEIINTFDQEPKKYNFNKFKRKKNLVLCHKFLYNKIRDESVRIVEWLETARAWGVDDVTFYLLGAHPNVERVLQHYQQQGFLTVVPWSNPGHHPNAPALQRLFYDTQRYELFTLENIPYTDCLLRHIHSHRYVAVWDIDEFLIPASPFQSLPQMVDAAKLRWFHAHSKQCGKVILSSDRIEEKQPNRQEDFEKRKKLQSNGTVEHFPKEMFEDFNKISETVILTPSFDGSRVSSDSNKCKPPVSYLGRCSYFFDNVSDPIDETNKNLHMMSHVTRTLKFTDVLVHTKGIHDTSRALGLHAHFALYSTDGAVNRDTELYQLYPASEGYLAHYRSECQGEDQTECVRLFRAFLERDERMWQHREQITRRATDTLHQLGLS